MGRIIHKNQPCLRCASHDACQIYEEGPAHCFSCNASYDYEKEYAKKNAGPLVYKKDNYQRRYKEYSVDDFIDLPVRGWKERLITRKVAEFFGVRASFDENGEINNIYFPFSNKNLDPVTVGFKRRNIHQKDDMSAIGEVKTLFGLEHFKNKGTRIVLTEGEVDALTVAETSLHKWNQIYPVASIGGVGQVNYLIRYRDLLRAYDEVVIWFDNDEQGQKAAKEAAKIIGFDKVKLVVSNEKDANEILMRYGIAEGTKRIWGYIYEAKTYSPAGIIPGEETWEKMKEFQSLKFIPWPPFLSRLNELTFGRALGTITMIAAGCHGEGTLLRLFNGGTIKVEDVDRGTILLGPDGTSRVVREVIFGEDELYEIQSVNPKYNYVANSQHLVFLSSGKTVTAKSLYDSGESFSQTLGSTWPGSVDKLPVDPFILGSWLGGSEPINKPGSNYLDSLPWPSRKIPDEFLRSSLENRQKLFEGLRSSWSVRGYTFFTEIQEFKDSFVELAESIGYDTCVGRYSVDVFPKITKVVKGSGIKSLGRGRFFGFDIEGDGLYTLANGLVTHNTSVGKSTLLREDIYHILTTTDYKIGACFLEEDVGETVEGIVGLHTNTRLGLPTAEVSEEEIHKAWEETVGLPNRTLFVDHQGSVSDGSLIEKIEHLAIQGCKLIYLDHITIAVSESEGDSINTAIDKFMSDLLKIVKRHECWIGVVSHLRKVKAGEVAFENGAPISEDDLKGSGSLKQISFQTIALSRNKLSENENVRHKTQIWLLKDRKTGNTGLGGAYKYNKVTGRLEEVEAKDNDEFEIELAE